MFYLGAKIIVIVELVWLQKRYSYRQSEGSTTVNDNEVIWPTLPLYIIVYSLHKYKSSIYCKQFIHIHLYNQLHIYLQRPHIKNIVYVSNTKTNNFNSAHCRLANKHCCNENHLHIDKSRIFLQYIRNQTQYK